MNTFPWWATVAALAAVILLLLACSAPTIKPEPDCYPPTACPGWEQPVYPKGES